VARNNLKSQRLVGKGAEAHNAGLFDRAEKYYKSALKFQRDNPDALHLLGLISHQKGRNGYAAKLIARAISLKPVEPAYNTNMAIVLNALGRWSEAENASIVAIKTEPRHAEAYNSLGRALAAQNKYAEAEEAYHKAIEFAPKNAAAENNLGYLYMQLERHDLAEEAFRRSIKIDGTFLLAYSNLATTYMAMNWFDRAEEVCRAALNISPEFIPALHSLGVVLTRTKNFEGAEQIFLQIIGLDSMHSQAILKLASLYSTLNRFKEAEELFKKAISLGTNNSHAYINLGICYSEYGLMDKALKCLYKATKCDPANIEAYYALTTSANGRLDATVINSLESNLISSAVGLTKDEIIKYNFTLAIQYERMGNLTRAFNFYLAGNHCRSDLFLAAGIAFDPELHYKKFDNYKLIFDDNFFAERKGWCAASTTGPAPVFIIGMPRSGTTLVEQIIAAHPMAVGAGELGEIEGFIDGFINEAGGQENFFSNISDLSIEQISVWAENFSAKIDRLGIGVTHVVDKTPFNYNHLWLIQLMYPEAKIIHCRRDARDVGLSCFQQNFVQHYPWTCDLAHIGHYTNAYVGLMSHWDKTLNLSILDVDYEYLVARPEVGSRAIIDFLELDWHESILDFHDSQNLVKTASKWQVRQPVYQHSSGRWQKYEKQLTPLVDIIENVRL
jgi:Flp pilus assembly protein TadD